MLTLYGADGSPFVRKVKVFLAEKNLAYKQEQVSPFPPSAEFKKLSPLGRIPAFRDDGKTLADSSIICAYLERTHPQPPLYPTDLYDFARALWFEEYGDGGIAPIVGIKMFFNKILSPRLIKRPFDEAMFRKAEQEELPPLLDYLEGELGGDFLVGKTLTIGDIGVATQFVNLRFAGVTLDAGKWPKLAAYLARIHSRPSFKTAIEVEEKILSGLR